MNIIARVATVIDPTGATAGANATTAAADKTAAALNRVAKASDGLTAALRKAGSGGRGAGEEGSKGLERMAQSGMNLIKILAGVYVAFQSLKAATSLIAGAIDAASQMEGFRTRWAYMLGSMDAAKVKMKELQTFANATPFDLPGVTEAAIALARLKKTGLEGMEGLTMVGNAAALAQQRIEDVASRVTRLVGNLQRGAGGGDEARALGEWGVFSPQLVGRIADMGQKASNFKVLLAQIKEELKKTDGAMGVMATTWSGLTSTMEDGWRTLKTTIGEPIMLALKPLIGDITVLLDEMNTEATKLAPTIRDMVSNIPAAFRVMRQEGGFKLMLQAAWDSFADLMRRTWDATGRYLGQVFTKLAYDFKSAMSDPAFWKGIADKFMEALLAALEAATPMLSNLWQSFGAVGDANKIEARQNLEQQRLKATGDLNARIVAARVAKPEGTITNADLGLGNSNIPAPSDGTYGNDLMNTPGGINDSLIGAPPPEPKFEMEAAKMTDAMTEAADKIAAAKVTVNEDIAKAEAANEAIFREQDMKRRARDANVPVTELMWGDIQDTAKFGANKSSFKEAPPNPFGLFPTDGTDDGSKAEKATVEATGTTWDEAQSLADSFKKENATPEEKMQEEQRLADGLLQINMITEETKQRVYAKTKEEYVKGQEEMAEAAKAAVEKQMDPLDRLMAQWGKLSENWKKAAAEIMDSVSNNITGAITSMIDGTKSAGQAFADMAKGIVQSILQIITKLVVQYALMAAMGMATGGFSAFAMGAVKAGKFHDGGVVGSGGSTTMVNPSIFNSATRFHSGGVAGLGANEVPAVLEKGETVLTRGDADKVRNRMKGKPETTAQPIEVTIANYFDPTQVDERVASNPHMVLNVISANAQKVRRTINGA